MAGYNRIIMVGNLTRDPDHKQLASGQSVCRLGLAANRQFRNKQTGDMVQEVCYIDVDVWGAQAESCKNYLQKGRPVLVEGRLKFDMWEDAQTGQNRNKHTVVADRVIFLGSSSQAAETSERKFSPSQAASENKEAEKELLDQINKVRSRVNQQKEAASGESAPRETKHTDEQKKDSAEDMLQKPSTGEIDFKDEAPFKDDLPF